MIEKPKSELLIPYKNFLGLSQDIPTIFANPKEQSTFLSIANNVDIDRRYKVKRRSGRTLRIAGDFKYMWSNGKRCFALQGEDLVEVSKTFEVSSLLQNIGTGVLSFADTQGSGIFFSNGIVIGKVLGGASLLSLNTSLHFKRVLPPGHLLYYYNGSVLSAMDNVIYISDVRNKNVYDSRTGFKQMESKIKEIGAVKDGLFISDSQKIIFAEGNVFYKSKVQEVLDVPMISGSVRTLYEITTPKGQYFKQAIQWACSKGIFIGGEGGNVENVTRDRVAIGERYAGTVIDREVGNIRQLINILK